MVKSIYLRYYYFYKGINKQATNNYLLLIEDDWPNDQSYDDLIPVPPNNSYNEAYGKVALLFFNFFFKEANLADFFECYNNYKGASNDPHSIALEIKSVMDFGLNGTFKYLRRVLNDHPQKNEQKKNYLIIAKAVKKFFNNLEFKKSNQQKFLQNSPHHLNRINKALDKGFSKIRTQL